MIVRDIYGLLRLCEIMARDMWTCISPTAVHYNIFGKEYGLVYKSHEKTTHLFDADIDIIVLNKLGNCELNLRYYRGTGTQRVDAIVKQILKNMGTPDTLLKSFETMNVTTRRNGKGVEEWIKFHITSPLLVPQTFDDLLGEL